MHAALAALAAVLLLPAHASVIGSTPAADDVLTAQPGAVSVVMNEEILAVEGAEGANALQVTDASGRFYGDGCAVVDGDTISLEAELGEAGEYALTYQVVSADGHPVSGSIPFAFEPAEGEAGAPGAAEAPVCGQAAEPGATEGEDAASGEGAATATPEPAPATASAEQGEAGVDGETTEGDASGSFPFLALGVLAVLAVLAVIAYRVNRARRDVGADRDAGNDRDAE